MGNMGGASRLWSFVMRDITAEREGRVYMQIEEHFQRKEMVMSIALGSHGVHEPTNGCEVLSVVRLDYGKH